MRVFVYEYVCARAGSPGSGGLPPSLAAEGRAMLRAVTEDLGAVAGVEVVSFPPVDPALEEQAFRTAVRSADYSLIIAPESDGILWQRCRWAEQEDGHLLGPSAPAVGLTGDKLMLGRMLSARGVPTPTPVPAERAAELPRPYVTKPRFGAGSLGIVRDGSEPVGGPRVAQPLVEGVAASVAFLIGPRERVALAPAAQHLSDDGRFTYLGGSVPLPAPLAERAERVARRAVECVPGLAGYVGIDVVVGPDAEWVIEINPRLTTSYVGLRALAEQNLAEVLLRVVRGEPAGAVTWRAGAVTFRPDGAVTAG